MDPIQKSPSKISNKFIISTVLIVSIIFGIAAFFIFQTKDKPKTETSVKVSTISADQKSSINRSSVTWSFNGSTWTNTGTPPACSDPLIFDLPVDISKVTAILYPGQTRGGNYKAHGGFRFDSDNNINVTAPLEANLVSGSRYIESGEVQYLFTFINSCGLAYRLDHLHTLSDKFQKIADQLPEAKVDDSRTTNFNHPAEIAKGEQVATKVGFVNTKNVGVDFGVYDLRKTNEASTVAAFATAHENFKEFIFYGICWLKELPDELSQKVLALPAGDGASGKTSDYCK